ncbi:hypothetical protein [Marinomonas sp. IMCC 4694]|uniref:hypothetical protein n=1 Tax=Marinomonas sp. IMCC 4694 TaxID=2605432 RepID=UPI0011E67F33|nr:hypothetical protein [Marinomonas sp. IMCC 4694]TYL48406.1 hypothetical protein FXV75_10905 [Marinomonas sp. IMCC 4694]
MIGFVSAISASLAIIILVVISALIGYVQSIMPAKGLIKINDLKYRYVMEGKFIENKLLEVIVIEIENAALSHRVVSYQTGCSYGFNTKKREMQEISTYNYLVLNQYFLNSMKIETTNNYETTEVLNTCYVDINFYPLEVREKNNG